MLLRLSTGRIAICDSHVVGTGFRTDFGPNLSALNMIIVSEKMRSQGLGRILMLSLMQSDADRAYRLIATRKGRPLYEKLGFVEVDQLVTVRGLLKTCPSHLKRTVLKTAIETVWFSLKARRMGVIVPLWWTGSLPMRNWQSCGIKASCKALLHGGDLHKAM